MLVPAHLRMALVALAVNRDPRDGGGGVLHVVHGRGTRGGSHLNWLTGSGLAVRLRRAGRALLFLTGAA